jgi:hypothetical protein
MTYQEHSSVPTSANLLSVLFLHSLKAFSGLNGQIGSTLLVVKMTLEKAEMKRSSDTEM